MKQGQKATFNIELTEKICKENHYGSNIATATVEVKESGAFDYGNGTCTELIVNTPDGITSKHLYDTRYVREEFDEFALNLIKDYCGDNIAHIERVENYTGTHHIGEIVYHKGGNTVHECKVVAVWCVDGRNGLTIVPTGNYGFATDIYEDQL